MGLNIYSPPVPVIILYRIYVQFKGYLPDGRRKILPRVTTTCISYGLRKAEHHHVVLKQSTTGGKGET